MPRKKKSRSNSYITRKTLETDMPLEKRKNPIIKVAIAGLGGVGKTTLCQRAMGRILDDYFANYKITIGVQFFTHTVETETGKVVLSVWDLAGQPQFHQIMDRFLKGCKGIILAYDSTIINSFFALYHTWIPLIQDNCEENIPIVLISTKNDLVDKREVNPEIVHNFINAKDDHKLNIIEFKETSSKTNVNVLETFEALCKTIIKNGKTTEPKTELKTAIIDSSK